MISIFICESEEYQLIDFSLPLAVAWSPEYSAAQFEG
jgi:hypothetical protein